MYQNSTIKGIPLNYSLFSRSQCIASCETSLAFHLHPKTETKNLWGWSTKSLIGGGDNFTTSMRRSSQDNVCGNISWKSVKYSQSYDFVCQMALLGGKGLIWCELLKKGVFTLVFSESPSQAPCSDTKCERSPI